MGTRVANVSMLIGDDGKLVGYVDPNGVHRDLAGFSLVAGANVTADQFMSRNMVRNTPVRVATFGDSTSEFIQSPGVGHDVQNITAAFPASGATSFGINSDKMGLPIVYHQAYPVGCGGIGGQTTAQMIARDGLATSSSRKSTTDIIDLKPDVVLLRGGSINDLMGIATSAAVDGVVAATFANHCEIITRFLSADIPVIDSGLYGFSGTATNPAATREAIVKLNALFAQFAARFPIRVHFIDWRSIVSDSTGAYLPGMCNSQDGIHLSVQGQLAASREEAKVLRRMFGRPAGPRFPGTNIFANSMFTASSTVGFGTLATGVTTGATNATRQNFKIEEIDGRKWQTGEWAVTASGGLGSFFMTYAPDLMGIAVNDVYGFEFDYMIEPVGNQNLPLPGAFFARLDTSKTAAGRIVLDMLGPAQPINPLGQRVQGKCVIGPFKYQEASASLTAGPSGWSIQFGTNELVTFKLGISMPRIVKL